MKTDTGRTSKLGDQHSVRRIQVPSDNDNTTYTGIGIEFDV